MVQHELYKIPNRIRQEMLSVLPRVPISLHIITYFPISLGCARSCTSSVEPFLQRGVACPIRRPLLQQCAAQFPEADFLGIAPSGRVGVLVRRLTTGCSEGKGSRVRYLRFGVQQLDSGRTGSISNRKEVTRKMRLKVREQEQC